MSKTILEDSRRNWFGEIPNNWNAKKLKYSAYLRSDKSNQDRVYVGLENVESNTGKILGTNEEMQESDAKLFEKNDVLLGKLRPYLAKVALVDFPGRCSSEFLVLKGLDYEPKFLEFLLISDGSIKTINSSTFGAKMPRAEWTFIGNMTFPLPSKSNQKIIADFILKNIKKIEIEIKQNKELIELLLGKKQATINQAITIGINPKVKTKNSGIEWIGEIPEHWNLINLKRISNISYGLGQPPKTKSRGIPIIRATNISKGEITLKDMIFCDLEDVSLNRTPQLKKGEILVVRSGVYTGDSAIIPTEYVGAIPGYDLRITPTNVNEKFLSFCLLSNVIKNQINIIKNRAAQEHLNSEELKNCFICMPDSKNEQKQIVDYLDEKNNKIYDLIYATSCQIKKLKEFRQSLIYSAVTGKITIKEKLN